MAGPLDNLMIHGLCGFVWGGGGRGNELTNELGFCINLPPPPNRPIITKNLRFAPQFSKFFGSFQKSRNSIVI